MTPVAIAVVVESVGAVCVGLMAFYLSCEAARLEKENEGLQVLLSNSRDKNGEYLEKIAEADQLRESAERQLSKACRHNMQLKGALERVRVAARVPDSQEA